MKHTLLVAFGFTLASTLAASAAEAPDPTGTWKWSQMFGKDSQSREVTLILKWEGDQLTGTLGGGRQETKIENGKYKDGEVSFTVTRERGGQKFTTRYTGKIDGDTIKGKVEFSRGENSQSRDWEAKREKK